MRYPGLWASNPALNFRQGSQRFENLWDEPYVFAVVVDAKGSARERGLAGSGTERGRERVRERECVLVCLCDKMTRFGRKRPRDLACEKRRQERIATGTSQGILFKRHIRATKLFEQTVLCP